MTDRIRSITVSDLITENLEVFSRLGVIHATHRILALVSDRDLAVTLLLHARKAWPDPQAADPSSVFGPLHGRKTVSFRELVVRRHQVLDLLVRRLGVDRRIPRGGVPHSILADPARDPTALS